MAIDKVVGATRRRNVKPISSIIKSNLTKDIDVSAMASPPEDGEFVVVQGLTGAFVDATFTAAGVPGATEVQGSMLRMVWSSAMRSDRQALGEKRVPVFWIGPIEIETNLYSYEDGTNLDAAGNYPVGTPVSVAPIPGAELIEGSNDRLVLTPIAPGQEGWSVGVVTRVDAGLPASGKKVQVLLYSTPRYINPN